ncbi:hypothetical protein HYPSUDRAFT_884856 [Hypholoma sublateritium FD-334 SS-4]|uniref:Secreted protein n=1 Tax=Hypholoma sublateritium (strain FD-334 SS-4) TaxID=945553 RepID=A0A0D2PAG4_HYPSF|nr:hypothetical protein HYPSUDRAFT_884856 [Hypholoma sublateritium FD-334 SS-4]
MAITACLIHRHLWVLFSKVCTAQHQPLDIQIFLSNLYFAGFEHLVGHPGSEQHHPSAASAAQMQTDSSLLGTNRLATGLI